MKLRKYNFLERAIRVDAFQKVFAQDTEETRKSLNGNFLLRVSLCKAGTCDGFPLIGNLTESRKGAFGQPMRGTKSRLISVPNMWALCLGQGPGLNKCTRVLNSGLHCQGCIFDCGHQVVSCLTPLFPGLSQQDRLYSRSVSEN